MIQNVVVLGATGSIGSSALDVIRAHPDRFKLIGASGWDNMPRLVEIVTAFHPQWISVKRTTDVLAAEGFDGLISRSHLFEDLSGLKELASLPDADIVVAGISGAAGLAPIFSALRAGKRVLIANKEPLVMCGELLMRAAREGQATVLPIDSEHNAIFQCLGQLQQKAVVRGTGRLSDSVPGVGVDRVTLTASGGPFLRTSLEALHEVSVDQALNHPTWEMGPKISVDSATLMNKGLELIEACAFFGLSEEQIDIVVHPQSMVHSLVHYRDGSVLAQMASADMRIPIAYALGYPERIPSGARPLDLVRLGRLDFESPDVSRFPSLLLARDAARTGGSMPAVLNAANEIAVSAFLAGDLRFIDISSLIAIVMEQADTVQLNSLEDVLAIDRYARAVATTVLREKFLN